MKAFDPARWVLLSLVLWTAGLATGCSHAPKTSHHHSSLISQHRLAVLTQPPAPAYYVVSDHFYGYHGTCWREWPPGWAPCVEPCSTWETAPSDHWLSPDMVPLPPADFAPPPMPSAGVHQPMRAPPHPPARELPAAESSEAGRPLLSDFFR
jgi:hypothetical protein